MKKKLLALPLLSLFCLTSCGETSSRYGVYAFTMGRSGKGETRVGLSINLKKDKEKDKEGKEIGEQFDIKLETDQLPEPYSLSGYYNYDEKTKRVKLNAKIEIQSSNESYVIPGELLQYIAVTYLENDTFTLKMPVSMPINPFDLSDINISRILDNDLLHQLVWYGYFIDLDAPNLYWDLRKTNYNPEEEGYVNPLPGDIVDGKVVKFEESIEKKLKKHPEVSDDTNEIALLNLQCKEIFSRARFYQKVSETSEDYNLIGSIVPQTIQSGEVYIFEPLNGYTIPVDKKIRCSIKEDFLGIYKTDVDVTLGDAKTITKICLRDEETVATTAEQYYKTYTPFEFRDYHQISIGLRKD